MSNFIKKISVKNVVGDVKKIIGNDETCIMRVIGIVRAMQSGQSDYGDWVKLKGDFQATNLLTGDVYRSPNCFLPEIATDMIAGVFSEDSEALQFGFDISVKPNDTPIGYEYNCASLIEADDNDPLQQLVGSVKAALPSPKKNTKK